MLVVLTAREIPSSPPFIADLSKAKQRKFSPEYRHSLQSQQATARWEVTSSVQIKVRCLPKTIPFSLSTLPWRSASPTNSLISAHCPERHTEIPLSSLYTAAAPRATLWPSPVPTRPLPP